MAPLTLPVRGRGQSVSDLGMTPNAPRSPSKGATPAQTNRWRRPPLPTLDRRTAAPIDALGRMTILCLKEEGGAKLPASALPWRELWNLPSIAAAGRPFDGPTRRLAVATQNSPVLRPSHAVTAGPTEAQFGFAGSGPLAPIRALSPAPEFREPQTDPASRPAMAGSGETSVQQPLLLATGQPSPTEPNARQYQVDPSDRDATAVGEQPERGKSTVSTLHIDGSALGRWTEQHLERALAKPSTGMTGVDPRATVPRSRVAPF
jgi:hypothetical protein